MCLAQSVQHATLDLKVMSSGPTVSIEFTFKALLLYYTVFLFPIFMFFFLLPD